MKIILLERLETQLYERKLKKKLVEETLRNPKQIVKGKRGKKVAQSKFLEEGKEYLIRVIFREEDDRRVGITAYKTSKVEKYWRME